MFFIIIVGFVFGIIIILDDGFGYIIFLRIYIDEFIGENGIKVVFFCDLDE